MADSEQSSSGQLGRIALKRVAVARKKPERSARVPEAREDPPENLANRLVPFLDIFWRLDDEELSRLASVPVNVAAEMRTQVDHIQSGLAAYVDLIERLSEAELVRLTQASPRTVRFWLLCQPRERPPLPIGGSAQSGTYPQEPTPEEVARDASSSITASVDEIAEPSPPQEDGRAKSLPADESDEFSIFDDDDFDDFDF